MFVFGRFLFSSCSRETVRCSSSDPLATSMSLLVLGIASMVVEAFLAKFTPKLFKQALVFLLVIIQKFFGLKRFPTEATVEFSAIMLVHVLLVSSSRWTSASDTPRKADKLANE